MSKKVIKEFKLEHVYKYAISCDSAVIKDGVPCNCMKDGIPDCGSGLLSYWGSKMIGMDDTKIRNFYEVDDPDFKPLIPKHIQENKQVTYDIHQIIDRIQLPANRLKKLHDLLYK